MVLERVELDALLLLEFEPLFSRAESPELSAPTLWKVTQGPGRHRPRDDRSGRAPALLGRGREGRAGGAGAAPAPPPRRRRRSPTRPTIPTELPRHARQWLAALRHRRAAAVELLPALRRRGPRRLAAPARRGAPTPAAHHAGRRPRPPSSACTTSSAPAPRSSSCRSPGCPVSGQEESQAMELRSGGGGGIRTPGTREDPAVFKTAAIDHSATPPSGAVSLALSRGVGLARRSLNVQKVRLAISSLARLAIQAIRTAL